MAAFTGPLVIKEIGYELWEVVEPFEFHGDDGLVVAVATGRKTDLASIPKSLRSFIPKLGYWTQGAVVHDTLYDRHRTGEDTETSRGRADRALLEGAIIKAREYDVPLINQRHHAIYSGVRLGGLSSWETQAERQTRMEKLIDDEFLDQ